MNLKTKCQSTVKKIIVINRIQNNSFCLHNICVCHSGVKKFLPPSCFFFVFLHICHTSMIQIIKHIFILHKDNPSKYKMQF